MRGVTEACVATTASATLAALGVQRLALFSPYLPGTHQHERAFLAEAGVRVVGGRCLGLHGGDEYIAVAPEEWLHMVDAETPSEAEGVFLSCTNIHSPVRDPAARTEPGQTPHCQQPGGLVVRAPTMWRVG